MLPFMVRQAHHERRSGSVRPEPHRSSWAAPFVL